MAFSGLGKAREVIRLDDSADSPEYILDLTDSELDRKQELLQSCVNDFYEVQERINEPDCNMGELMAKMAAVYGAIIKAFLGKRAYREIVDFVTDGDKTIKRSEINVLLSPLVLYLIDRYVEVVRPREFEQAARKYLDEEPAAI